MRSLIRPTTRRADPAPSRWGYRYQRLMLTPLFRRFLRVGLPLSVVVLVAGVWTANEENRASVVEGWAELRASIETRPEFMVNLMEIEGADPLLREEVRTVLPVEFPISSFDLDLDEMKQTVAALNRVASASLRIAPGGVLNVTVDPRVPAAIWRHHDGLRLIDETGTFVAPLGRRADRLDLPLIAGDGARTQIEEALRLYEVAGPIAPRVRGLVRMGERRWDVILDRDQRLLLPEEGAETALSRIVALAEAKDLLERDVAVVDMRNGARPTVRLQPGAFSELRRINGVSVGEE